MSFRYWAFISYSSKDAALSKRLHYRLETYAIPRDLVGRPGRDGAVPKKLFPCFRDRDELPLSSDLGGSIEDALRASRYLIVICTPASAQSRWVNEEVRFFKSLGRSDRILAIIAGGEPNASDQATGKERECFAPALRHEVDGAGQLTGERAEPIAGDLRPGGDGWTNTFLKAVAGITGLGFNAFAQREVKRQRRRHAFLAALGLAAVLGGLYAWDYNRTKAGYYTTLTDVWGVPQGVAPLTQDGARRRGISYRIESSQRKVRQVFRINGEGELQDDADNFGAALQEVQYRENGQVSEIDLRDHNRQSVVREVFDERQPNSMTQTVEFKRELKDQPFSVAVASDTSEIVQLRTDITAQSLTYDAQGRTEQISYLDNYRNPTEDDTGVWGLRYQRNEAGLPEEIENLGSDGKPVPDHSGVVAKRLSYNSQNLPARKDWWGADKSLIMGPRGCARVAYLYDTNGNEIEEAYSGTDGKSLLCTDWGTARITMQRDEHGNDIEADYFGTDGQPIPRKDMGAARIISKYDERGNLIEEDYFGIHGEPILSTDFGAARRTAKWDEHGNALEEDYFDTANKPVLRKNIGAARITAKFDERGKLIEYNFFGTDGKPILSKLGVAHFELKWDERGYLNEIACFDTRGQPILSFLGFARATSKFDDRGNEIEDDYFGPDGQPIPRVDVGAARITSKYDEHGNRVELAYFGSDGQPVLRKDVGAFRIDYTFDERGNEIGEDYFGTEGKPILVTLTGCARMTMKRDERGNLIEADYFGTDGQPILRKDTGAARATWKFDANGNTIEDRNFGLDGKLIVSKDGGYAYATHQFDARGNKTEDCYFGPDEKPMEVKGAARLTYEYDAAGNLVITTRYDKAGRVLR